MIWRRHFPARAVLWAHGKSRNKRVAEKKSRKEVAKKLAITGAKTQSPKERHCKKSREKKECKKSRGKKECKKSHEKEGTVKKDTKKEESISFGWHPSEAP